ncbi:MAG: hypothetical protein HY078_04465 [Elusimicrobia bacterium]|nr:hypothetical protein [Elusimicrobiota bacterium]
MFWSRLIVSVVEFFLSGALAIFVVFWSYKSFAAFTEGYDVIEELKKQNTAVAIVLTSMMVATSMLMQQSVYPVISIVTLYMQTNGEAGVSIWRVVAYSIGHLILGFLLSIGSIELALRTFEKLSDVDDLDEEKELKAGNSAVAIVMAGVVIVTAFYLQNGISSVTKSLIPRPSLGELRSFK